MSRTTKKELEQILNVTNHKLGTDYIITRAYGQPKVETADQSASISPRLSSGKLYLWLEAFNAGIDAITRKQAQDDRDRIERARVAAMCNGYTNWSTWHVQLIVDNDETLYDARNEWVDEQVDAKLTADEMSEDMLDQWFYQDAIEQTAAMDKDGSTTYITQEVNWEELAKDNLNDRKERLS